MNAAQAQALADAQWTDRSHADPREHQRGIAEYDDYWGFNVGIQSFSGYYMRGHGASWEEACARAGLVETGAAT